MKNNLILRKATLFSLCLLLSIGFLQTNFVAAASYTESEDNNNRSNADKITSGAVYSGTFNESDDTDCFKYKATANGTISVKLTYNSPAGDTYGILLGVGTDVSIDNMFCEYLEEDIHSCDIPVTKGSTYYIKVKNESSFSFQPEDGFYYSIKLTIKTNNYIERENNNSKSKATKLTLNKWTTGTNTTDADTDFYKITATKSGKLKIKFYHYSDDSLNFIFNVGTNSRADNLRKQYSSDDMSCKINVTKGKTYYIKVATYSNFYSELGSRYKIKAYY